MNLSTCYDGPSCDKCYSSLIRRPQWPNGVIFIHNRKCAGTSIQKRLGSWRVHDRHQTAHETCIRVGQENWDKAFKFSFIRNPWDRWVSLYRMRINSDDMSHFREYTCQLAEERLDLINVLFTLPTPYWYSLTIDNKLAMDFIGRFEYLQQDWEYVAEHLNLKSKLPNINPNRAGKAAPYQEYYDAASRDAIAEVYKKDIEYWGYKF